MLEDDQRATGPTPASAGSASIGASGNLGRYMREAPAIVGVGHPRRAPTVTHEPMRRSPRRHMTIEKMA